MLTKDGTILIDKDESWSSQDVCSKLKHILNTKKVGHTGTLDPFATGLLIVCVNEATKIARFIEEKDKCYIAKLKLGELKDTGDKTGKTLLEKEIPTFTKEDVINAFSFFKGKIKQVAPLYSALKVNGMALYKYAREGIEVERKEREVEIYSLDLISFDTDSIIFSCKVSKGTYIRTLGEDIAVKLGTVGYLEELRRTKVGELNVNNAKKLCDVSEKDIIPIEDSLPFKKIILNEKDYKLAINGHDLFITNQDDIVSTYSKENKIVGIYQRVNDNIYHCIRGFKNESN